MAIVAEYRDETLKTVVRIHDDCMIAPEKRQALFNHIFSYVEDAYIRNASEKEMVTDG